MFAHSAIEILTSTALSSTALIGGVSRIWYCVPLIVSISLVYGATRHELMPQILEHATRFGIWVVTFMLAIFALTVLMTWLV
jgi:hypothetical protein